MTQFWEQVDVSSRDSQFLLQIFLQFLTLQLLLFIDFVVKNLFNWHLLFLFEKSFFHYFRIFKAFSQVDRKEAKYWLIQISNDMVLHCSSQRRPVLSVFWQIYRSSINHLNINWSSCLHWLSFNVFNLPFQLLSFRGIALRLSIHFETFIVKDDERLSYWDKAFTFHPS